MTTRVPELFILLVSLLKWFVLASLVGSIVGVSTTLFLTILDASLALTQTFPYAFLLLPIGLTISAWITTRIAPETQGHGTERVVQAIHQRHVP